MYHQLKAAQGFLELGDPDSAWEELESIPAEDRAHQAVLWMRLEIYSTKKRWDGVVEIAKHLVKTSPEAPQHWIDLAWGQRRANDLQTAEKTLKEALGRFPNEAVIHYNLACYSCVSGREDEAKGLLDVAFRLDPSLKATALEDEDLVGMW
jgi:Tfp pilus assembly protein PilF